MVISLLGHDVLRAILGVGGAAAFSNLLSFGLAFIISRLFTQEDFGQFGLFFSLANVLVPLSLLGLHDSLLAAMSERDARALLKAVGVIILLSAPVLGGVAYGVIIFDFFGYGVLPKWSGILIFVEIAAISAVNVIQIWLIRDTHFSPLAMGHLIQGLMRAGSQVGSGLCGLGYLGLGLSEVLSRAIVAIVLLRKVWRDFQHAAVVPIQEACRAVWQFRLFVLARTPSTLVFNLGTALPPILITRVYGVSSAGLYVFMFSVIIIPAGFVQKAYGDVFLGHFVRRYKSDIANAQKFLILNAGGLFLISVPLGAILLFWGPDIFSLIFGTQWREAGHLASLTVPLFMASIAFGPLGGVLSVVNRPEAKLLFDMTRIAGCYGAYVIVVASAAPLNTMIVLLTWFGVLSYLVYLALIFIAICNPRQSDTGSIHLSPRLG